jgi:hypothetical protein
MSLVMDDKTRKTRSASTGGGCCSDGRTTVAVKEFVWIHRGSRLPPRFFFLVLYVSQHTITPDGDDRNNNHSNNNNNNNRRHHEIKRGDNGLTRA